MPEHIYNQMVNAGVPIAHWQSDLYVPVNPTTTSILSLIPETKKIATTFRHNINGRLWYDIPFAYLPFWEMTGGTKHNP